MNIKEAKKISKALSDDTRLQILQELKNKTNCLQCIDIFEIINLSQPSISHHVKQLADADLITVEKEGRKVRYQLNQKVLDDYISFLKELKCF
jgi:ArsR family transcriptional regulator, arsenate/arsenite/antimonite-responsive transcriptional repressor